ncbi:hypothetical protein [Streptomyces sp. CRPSP2-6A1]|uniref:hypothetical protein n=1 Tax=Streptomyces sp. CRPSP2-6A1 TaxID=2799588 RepID=UPI0027DCAE8C|nr:hypothetical protein [Streptomyces sp. CRPSP2-6A1]
MAVAESSGGGAWESLWPGLSRTVFRAEVKRSSRESGAVVGPVSPVASSYS